MLTYLKNTPNVCFIKSDITFSCGICDYKCENETGTKQHRRMNHVATCDKPAEILKFKCDLCEYESVSKKGVNIHKGSKHKTVLPSNSFPTAEATSKQPSNTSLNPPISCIRYGDGCENLGSDYFDRFTAMCNDCQKFMKSLQESSPFSSTMCPCCHDPIGGDPYSLCSTCMDYLLKEGFSESEWGAWVLDRNSGKVICLQLDF